MKVFFDTEFTGLHQNTTLISIGLVDESGRTFYGELTDYDRGQVDDWIGDNVMVNLRLTIGPGEYLRKTSTPTNNDVECIGRSVEISHELKRWLSAYDYVEMWSDVLTYDWMLLRELFNNKLPDNVLYIPFDLATLLWDNCFDPDVSREEFAGLDDDGRKHNALWDARVIKACYERVVKDG